MKIPTFAREFLPNEAQCPAFINADLIAAGLSPFQPEPAAIKAGKLMLKEMAENAERGRSFAFETTLAERSYVHMIREWRQQQGYEVKLFFSKQSIDLKSTIGAGMTIVETRIP